MNYKLIIICILLFVLNYDGRAQIKINSSDEVADKLANQVEGANSKVINEWSELANLYNSRNDEAIKFCNKIESIRGKKSDYSNQLFTLIKNSKGIGDYSTIIIDKNKFLSYRKYQEDIDKQLNKIFELIVKEKINNSLYEDFEMNLNQLQNRIAVKRQTYNAKAIEYNIKIKNANSKFFEKYPSFGKKYYFESHDNSPAPKVQF